MDDSFNPYQTWLGLGDAISDPDFYQLLGIARFETDVTRIAQAAERALARVRSCRPGQHARRWAELLDQLGEAKKTLTNPEAKAAYDARLKGESDSGDVAPSTSTNDETPVPSPSPNETPLRTENRSHHQDGAAAPIAQVPPSPGGPAAPAPVASPYVAPAAPTSHGESRHDANSLPDQAGSRPAGTDSTASPGYQVPTIPTVPMPAADQTPVQQTSAVSPAGQSGSSGMPTSPSLPANSGPATTPAQPGPAAPMAIPWRPPANATPGPSTVQPASPQHVPQSPQQGPAGATWNQVYPAIPSPPLSAASGTESSSASNPMAPLQGTDSPFTFHNATSQDSLPQGDAAGSTPQLPSYPAARQPAIPVGTIPVGIAAGAPHVELQTTQASDAGTGEKAVAWSPVAVPQSGAVSNSRVAAGEEAEGMSKPLRLAVGGSLLLLLVSIVVFAATHFGGDATDDQTVAAGDPASDPASAGHPETEVDDTGNDSHNSDSSEGQSSEAPDNTEIVMPVDDPAVVVETPTVNTEPVVDVPAVSLDTPVVADPSVSPSPVGDPSASVSPGPPPMVADPSADTVPAATDPIPPTPPETVPAPAPSPVANPANAAALQQALATARVALGEQNFSVAEAEVAKAESLAGTDEEKAMVARAKQLAYYVKEFRDALNSAIDGLEAGETIKVGTSTEVGFVEGDHEKLVLRVQGRNRPFEVSRLPRGLALAIADLWFDQSDPATLVFKGAYQFTHPQADAEDIKEVRTWWEEAALAGVDIQTLLPVLDDK